MNNNFKYETLRKLNLKVTGKHKNENRGTFEVQLRNNTDATQGQFNAFLFYINQLIIYFIIS